MTDQQTVDLQKPTNPEHVVAPGQADYGVHLWATGYVTDVNADPENEGK